MKTLFKCMSVALASSLLLTSCNSGGGNNNNNATNLNNVGIGAIPTYPRTTYPTTPGVPSVNTTSQLGLRTFTCQLQVRKGQAYYPGTAQQFTLPQSGGRITLISPTMQNRKVWSIFNVAYMKNLATVVLDYTPAMANSGTLDTVKMSVSNIDGDISASVSGYAGTETRIELAPKDTESGESTEMIVSCVGVGMNSVYNTTTMNQPVATTTSGRVPPAMNQAATTVNAATPAATNATTMITQAPKEKFACKGTETLNGRTREIDYVNNISDVIASGISVSNSVFIQAEGTASSGLVTFAQSNLGILSSTDINLQTSLMANSTVTIEKSDYSLKLKCQPK